MSDLDMMWGGDKITRCFREREEFFSPLRVADARRTCDDWHVSECDAVWLMQIGMLMWELMLLLLVRERTRERKRRLGIPRAGRVPAIRRLSKQHHGRGRVWWQGVPGERVERRRRERERANGRRDSELHALGGTVAVAAARGRRWGRRWGRPLDPTGRAPSVLALRRRLSLRVARGPRHERGEGHLFAVGWLRVVCGVAWAVGLGGGILRLRCGVLGVIG